MAIRPAICVLCGTNSEERTILNGRNGALCRLCLGEAFAAVAKAPDGSRGTASLTANRRCLLCDAGVTDGRTVAFRHPYCLCGGCLTTLFTDAMVREDAPLTVIHF